MTKTNILSELFAETGIKGSTVIWLLILNVVRIISIFAAVVLAAVWIVTQNNAFGWALIYPAVAFTICAVGGFVLGARMMLK